MHIGFDIGGTKLAAIGLDDDGQERARLRRPVPKSFEGVVDTVAEMVDRSWRGRRERAATCRGREPARRHHAGRRDRHDRQPALARRAAAAARPWRRGSACPVALANDANCFALSEATDGAAAGAEVVFGVILGTGVGGGLIVRGEVVVGANATAGEWGHNPWPTPDGAGVPCACGRFAQGCVETWLNGAALVRDYAALGGGEATAEEIGARAAAGDAQAADTVARYAERLAQALAGVINVVDPDVIVLGGGLSEIAALYRLVPAAWGNARERRPAHHSARPRALRARERPAWCCPRLTPRGVSAAAGSS